jgi:hypothetical protein
MANYGSTDKVRKSASEHYISPARRRHESTVAIHSGDFGKYLVQNNVLPPNRFPIICNALRSRAFLRENHLTLEKVQGPPSGKSSTVTFIYQLQPIPNDSAIPRQVSAAGSSFMALRGILKSSYRKLGGADAFHHNESRKWDK